MKKQLAILTLALSCAAAPLDPPCEYPLGRPVVKTMLSNSPTPNQIFFWFQALPEQHWYFEFSTDLVNWFPTTNITLYPCGVRVFETSLNVHQQIFVRAACANNCID